ncbi:MAG TPA: thiamine-phosphate kinase [Nitrospirota bacterium]|nr:thiamine-phosphate kinase [Nitrospirota bacterium]
MKLSELGEFGLIEKLRNSFRVRSDRVQIGIGDDAAVLKLTSTESLLATADMLIEGVHFDLAFTDFYSLGWKSAAVNLSDIAAMGGNPRFCLTSLGISPAITVEQISDFYRGCKAVLRRSGVVLVGGDTCLSPKAFVISITLLGETVRKTKLLRSGARPGDRIFVTGTLGDAAAGLELLRTGRAPDDRSGRKLTAKHLRPEPRIAWGRVIARAGAAHAMIDVSDGLSSDLIHLSEESGVGAVVNADAIPVSRQLCRLSGSLSLSPLTYALDGGEDYELLFTAPPGKLASLRSLGIELHEIGLITKSRSCFIVEGNGTRKKLKPGGYDHFRKT